MPGEDRALLFKGNNIKIRLIGSNLSGVLLCRVNRACGPKLARFLTGTPPRRCRQCCLMTRLMWNTCSPALALTALIVQLMWHACTCAWLVPGWLTPLPEVNMETSTHDNGQAPGTPDTIDELWDDFVAETGGLSTANNPATSSQNSQALTLQCSDDDTAHLFCDEALVTVDNPQDVQTCWCELQPCLCLAGDQEDEQDDATVILPQENTIESDIMQVDAFTPDLVGASLTPQSQLSEDYVDVHQDDISLGDLLGLADGQGTQSVEATPLETVTRTDSLLPIQSTSCGSDQSPVRDCMAASGSGFVGASPIRLHLTQQEVRAFRSPGAFEKLVDMVSRRLQERRPDDYRDIARRALQSFTEVRCPFAACPVSHVVTPPACRTQQAPPCLAGPDSCDVLEVTRANMWSSGHFRTLGHLQPVKNNNCLGIQGTRHVCIKGSNAKGNLMQMITDCHSRWHSADQRQWGHHASRKLRPSKRNLYPLHLRLTYLPPKGIMDCCLPTSACVWRPSDYNLTGTTQTCGCGLRDHRACQQLRLHINFYRKCNLRWSCKGSAPKAAVCCQEPTLPSWESACAKARATSFMIEDSYQRSLIPRTASPIPGLWVHHAGPALGRLRMLITKRTTHSSLMPHTSCMVRLLPVALLQ